MNLCVFLIKPQHYVSFYGRYLITEFQVSTNKAQKEMMREVQEIVR